ncbi:MAG: Oligosaccharyl transferase subunit [Rariglobus sp.]|nr:Oligosaccharyl transferase subunit [Rariglobus sp.]
MQLPKPFGDYRRGVMVLLAGLGFIVFLLRVFPGWEFLAPQGDLAILPENDPYFHFRQALYSVRHFPALLRWDDASQYPAVLRNDSAGLYDLFLAALAKAGAFVTGAAPERALLWVCLFVPPLGAAVLVPLVFGLVRRQAPVGIAAVMALWCVLLPGDGLTRTSLGFCDHHVAEMVLSLLCVRGALTALNPGRRSPAPLPWWRPAWGAALPLAVLFFTWVGAPLYLPVFALAFIGQIFADALQGRDTEATTRAALRFWLALLVLVGGAGVVFPSLVMHVGLWRSAVPALALVPVACVLLDWIFRTPRLRAGVRGRALLAVGLFTLSIAGAMVASATVRGAVFDAVAVKSAVIQENQAVTPRFFFLVTGLAGVLALLVPLAGWLTPAGRKPGWWLAVLPGFLLIALWCRVHDYAYLGAVHAVVLAGYFWSALESRGTVRFWGRPGVWLGAATAVIGAGIALGWTAPLRPGRELYSLPGFLPGEGLREALRWLRAQPLPVAKGAAGVLGDWQRGNLINTVAGWPAVTSRYPQAEPMNVFYLTSEAEARAAPLQGSNLAESVRYVVVEPPMIYDDFASHLGVAGLPVERFYRAQPFNHHGQTWRVPRITSEFRQMTGFRFLLRDGVGLEHFRLVFESRAEVFNRFGYDPGTGNYEPVTSVIIDAAQRDRLAGRIRERIWQEGAFLVYDAQILPAVKIYEQVKGARIEGRGKPGATITATLGLRLKSTRRLFFDTVTTRADADGRFVLTVPYASGENANGSVGAIGPWKINDGERDREMVVPESAVIEGVTLVLPE